MPRVVVTAASFCKNSVLRAEAVQVFARHEVVFHPVDPASSPHDVASALNGFDAAIVGRETIGPEVLALSNPPAIIAIYGVGMDNIDPLVLDKLTVLSAPGSNAFAVAEHTLGLILALTHNIAKCDRLLRGGTWWKDGGVAVAGKTVAVIGVGAVGTTGLLAVSNGQGSGAPRKGELIKMTERKTSGRVSAHHPARGEP